LAQAAKKEEKKKKRISEKALTSEWREGGG